MRTIVALVALAAACLSGPRAALAQSEADFVAAFSGEWQTLDPAYAANGACRVTLDPSKSESAYTIQSRNCGGPFQGLQGWRIVDNQLGLVGKESTVVARLGGNQSRMSGDVIGGGNVVFERLAPSTEKAATAVPDPAASCIFYGYTASCAQPKDRERPAPVGSDTVARASVLVRLNARAEARPDAPVVATIPANTCVIVEECTTASDGNWCRAKISNYSGWIRQQAVRADKWPVLTFSPGC